MCPFREDVVRDDRDRALTALLLGVVLSLPACSGTARREGGPPTEEDVQVLKGRYWHFVEDVRRDPSYAGGKPEIRLWVSLPVDRPEHRVRIGEISPPPTEIIHDAATGNRVIYWRVIDPPEGGRLVFHYDFEVVNRVVRSRIDPDRVQQAATDSPERRRFTVSEPWDEIDPDLAAEAKRIVGDETNPYRQARLVFDWVVENMTYDYPPIGNRGARQSFGRKGGDCGEFSRVFVAMMRSLGVPARLVFACWPEGSGHAWAEAFFPPYGWIPVDTSMAQLVLNRLKGQMPEKAAEDFLRLRGIAKGDPGFLFGNLYASRLVVFIGENLRVAPASGPERTFVYLQPGGATAWPPAFEMDGLSKETAATGFYRFGEGAADERAAIEHAGEELGAAWLGAGLFEKAIPALRRKLARSPRDSETLFQLGHALFSLGRYEEARSAFEQSLAGEGGSAKRTEDTWCHILIGMCWDAAGNREAAKAAYQKALDLGVDQGGSLETARSLLEKPFRPDTGDGKK